MPSFGFIMSFPLPEGGYPALIRYPKTKSLIKNNYQKDSNTYKPFVRKEIEYENEDTDPEITPLNNSNKINYKQNNHQRPNNYDAASIPVPVEVINSKRSKNDSSNIMKQELLRDQIKLQKKLHNVEKHRVELHQIINKKKAKRHNFEPEQIDNSRNVQYEQNSEEYQDSRSDEASESEEEKQAPVAYSNHSNIMRVKSGPGASHKLNMHKSESELIKTDDEFEMQNSESNDSNHDFLVNTETEDDVCSIDLEYKERLIKEQELNDLLKKQEQQLLKRRQEIEQEIKSRYTEVGSPKSIGDSMRIEIENRPAKSMSVGRYTKQKHMPEVPKTLNCRVREPLGSSSIMNMEPNKIHSRVLR